MYFHLFMLMFPLQGKRLFLVGGGRDHRASQLGRAGQLVSRAGQLVSRAGQLMSRASQLVSRAGQLV
jgi:hypothetical protein